VYSYLVENDVGAPMNVGNAPKACAAQGPSSGGCSSQAFGWMPGIGVVAGTTHLNFFTSLYRGYSGPRISQAITPTGQDTNLQAETSTNWELGVRGRVAGWLRAEADTFILNFDNQLVDNNPFYGTTSEFIDGGKTQHIGVEATVKLRIGAAFRLPVDIDLAGTYTFIRSRFVGGTFNGHTVPYSPANTANLVLNVAHKIGLSAELAFQFVGAQYSDEQNTLQPDPTGLTGVVPQYTVLDWNVRYRNKRTGLSVAFIMKSALNKVYVSDRLPDGIFTAGFREILGTLAWSRE
jgi:Fe(3+) dicitrate transport protein